MRSDPAAHPGLVSLARNGVRLTTDPSHLTAARRHFADTQAIVFQQLLEPALLAEVRSRLSGVSFVERVHEASGVEACMPHNDVVWMLRFLLQDPAWLAWIADVTDSGPLEIAEARVYQFAPGTRHHHDWHDDWSGRRRLGLSINLSEQMFEGGRLQIRDCITGRVTADIANTGPGDGVIFRLGKRTEHRVLPVTGAHPRTVLAGWLLAPQAVIA